MAVDVTVDKAGNVYVTGYSTNLPFGADYLTIKYNAAGAKIWEARYNGPGNVDDRAVAIAVDDAGHVYVTGTSWGGSSDYDYATVKYNSDGMEQWVARYNGPENFFDEATDLAVDGAGNVYVNGRNWKRNSHYDYATIKYNSAGMQQWVARFNGPNVFSNEGTKLAVDRAGNVYIVGLTTGIGIDFATIKYNSAGVQQWLTRYNGTGNGFDAATAVTVDSSGNVYVTGWSTGIGTNADFATIKYNSAGVQQWVARYNGPDNGFDLPLALAVDMAGNVYVSGLFNVVVKYNSAGVQEWVVQTGNSILAPDVAVDAAGNIYVTGSNNGDYVTLKYNGAGVQQWIARFEAAGIPAALALDAAGNVFVTGRSTIFGPGRTGSDYATVKYSGFGVEQWNALYNGPGSSLDQANDIAVDAAGNIYVTGSSGSANTERDYLTIKYNAAGEQQWTARYNGARGFSDDAYAIAVDSLGNVYVTGASWGPVIGTGTEYATIKYNNAGLQQWVARYDTPGFDTPTDLAVDAAGNVYVTGRSFSGIDDYATIKYNSAGVQQWVARYDGPANSSDAASALAVDDAGNVYVTGSSTGSGTGTDYATIKYNAAGVEQWVARYNGPANLSDAATALTVDTAGNVYVTGWSTGSATDRDYTTIKYNAAGVEQWVARYNGLGNSSDQAVACVVDKMGNLHVTGWSVGSGLTGADYVTIKYNIAGGQQWVARYNGPGNYFDEATDLALDAAGNVYVTGWSWGPDRSYNFATVKYNAIGAEQWVARNTGPGGTFDRATALAVDLAGNVYVTGQSSGLGWNVYTTIRYIPPAPPSPTLVTPSNGANNQPATLKLSWNAAPDARTYHLQVSTSSVFATTVVDDSTLTITSREIGPLANKTTYYWRVNARNVGGISAWSSVWSFTTIVAAPSVPVLAAPADSAVNQSTTLTLRWNPVTDAETYRLQLATNSDFSTTVVDDSTITTNFRQVGPLTHEMTYYWRVRAKNIAGASNWSNVWSFTTVIAPPAAPALASPMDKAINQPPTLTLSWSPATRAETYRLQVSTNSDFATTVVDDSTLTITSREVGPLANNTAYYWRVRAKNIGGFSAWSKTWRFTTIIQLPSQVLLLLPGQAAILPSGNVQFSWRQSQPAISRYWFEIAADSAMTNSVIDSTLAATDTTKTVLDLNNKQTYWWRVRAGNAAGWGAFSEQRRFSIDVPVSVEETESPPAEFSLRQNYPNPFNPSTAINYELPKQAEVKLDIYDLQGRRIRTLVNQRQPAGRYTITWDGRNEQGEVVTSGVYIYQLRAGNFVQTRRMALVR
ncbi:MAG: SBBP repeat-containing protein [candidate division KSB1 bacterium]|nr:SBBP repeat-containing protein [candidate division KSB1 bacterium]MDZ7369259.1 SBBP repeat-containing protein [candidate division KSB1 bacterium]MDZ7406415.1 SBBP repeat-containing protein [candidate division KSB1 bacterium]